MPDAIEFSRDEQGLYHGHHKGFETVGALRRGAAYYTLLLNAETKTNSGVSYVIEAGKINQLLKGVKANIWVIERENGIEYKNGVGGYARYSLSEQAINFHIAGYLLLTTPKSMFKQLVEGKVEEIKVSTAPKDT